MTINKFQGKTESEAIERAKKEMGPDVVIMNVRTIKPKGMFRALKGVLYEVTAALEEAEPEKVVRAEVPVKQPESINLAADEQIRIPYSAPPQQELEKQAEKVLLQLQKQGAKETQDYAQSNQLQSSAIEERLDSLQSLLEERISAEKKNQEDGLGVSDESKTKEGFSFVKMLYQTLLDNEVHEKFANQILDELEKVSGKGTSIDYKIGRAHV